MKHPSRMSIGLMQTGRTVRRWLLSGRRGSFWRSVFRVRFVVVALVLMFFGNYVSKLWLVDIANRAAVGAMMVAAPEIPVRYVRTVEIDTSDYGQSASPLEANRLQELLNALIELKPGAIVVDIDTSAQSFRTLQLPATDVPIVWARRFSVENEKPLPVLGQSSVDQLHWGYINYRPGFDGYYSDFSRVFNDKISEEYMLHWAAVLAFCDRPTPPEVCSELDRKEKGELAVLEIGVRSDLESLSANEVLKEKEEFDSNPNTNKTSEMFTGRLIFLGGKSPQCQTYLGSMPCVRLLAIAAESELVHGRMWRLPDAATKLLEVCVGIIVAGLYYYLRPMPAMLTTFFLLSLLIAYVSYRATLLGISIDFIPFVIGIWLELMVRSGEEAEG